MTSSIKLEHTYIHPFNGPFSGTTRVSRFQKGKTNLDFTEARDSDWQWHQLGAFEMKGLRRMLRVSWTAKKTNEWVLNKAGVTVSYTHLTLPTTPYV